MNETIDAAGLVAGPIVTQPTLSENQVDTNMAIRPQTMIAGAALVGGLAIAAVVVNQSDPLPERPAAPDSAAYFDASADADKRIRALEIAVGEERNARQLLEVELRVLMEELDDLQSVDSGPVSSLAAEVQDSSDADAARLAMKQQRGDRFSPEGRTQALITAGFAPDRAATIVQREAEMQMASLQARYEMRQSGERPNPDNLVLNPDAAMRAELGETDYVTYLEAYGRPRAGGINAIKLDDDDRLVSVFRVSDDEDADRGGQAGRNVEPVDARAELVLGHALAPADLLQGVPHGGFQAQAGSVRPDMDVAVDQRAGILTQPSWLAAFATTTRTT